MQIFQIKMIKQGFWAITGDFPQKKDIVIDSGGIAFEGLFIPDQRYALLKITKLIV